MLGVEIGARAKNVSARPFAQKTLLLLGNEGEGLSQVQMDACDELVFIPQYGRGTASLNVATAAAVVLHHFAEWAQYPQHAPIDGAKFRVDESRVRQDPGMLLMQQERQPQQQAPTAAAAASSAAAAASSAAAASASASSAEGDGADDTGDAEE